MRPRPGLYETEAETKTIYCEIETKKVVSRPSQDLNISELTPDRRVFVSRYDPLHGELYMLC